LIFDKFLAAEISAKSTSFLFDRCSTKVEKTCCLFKGQLNRSTRF
jgi:hypothetical protein